MNDNPDNPIENLTVLLRRTGLRRSNKNEFRRVLLAALETYGPLVLEAAVLDNITAKDSVESTYDPIARRWTYFRVRG